MTMIKPTNDNSSIAVIKTNIEYIQKDINDIKTVLKDGYVTKDSLAQVARETEGRLSRLESTKNFWQWFSPLLSGTLGSILTFLTINYFMNIKG